MPTEGELVELMEQAWSSVDELASALGPEDWERPTDCPGWTVKDQLSHLASLEAILAGRPAAEGELPGPPHVKNDFGAFNEREVAARRGRAVEEILAEFRDATAERLKTLSGLDEAGWSEVVQFGPFGAAPVRDRIPIRITDVFYHEQDMRRAVGRPGHMRGGVARLVLDRMTYGMGMVVGKLVQPPDGTTVVFEVAPPGRTFAYEMRGRRAERVETPAAPTVRLTMDAEAFLCLVGGRWSPERASADGRLAVEGDRGLATAILARMAVVP